MKHKLKELVRAGTITPADALRDLYRRASERNEARYVKTTPTSRWLVKRHKEERNARA